MAIIGVPNTKSRPGRLLNYKEERAAQAEKAAEALAQGKEAYRTFDSKRDQWIMIREEVVTLAAERIRREDKANGMWNMREGRLVLALEKAGADVLQEVDPFARLSKVLWNNMLRLLREELTSRVLDKGVVTLARRKAAGITVLDEGDNPIAAPRPGMDAINMNDSTTTMEREAAAAGIPIVRNTGGAATRIAEKEARKPKTETFCLYCGLPTNGGRFRPGGDAKLKSALVRRYRDENATIDAPDMSDELRTRLATGDLSTREGAYNELIQLGWEKFATDAPVKAKREKMPDDGLGKGNYAVRSTDGTLLQRASNDEEALEWAEQNNLELVESRASEIVVQQSDPEDEEDEEDEDEDEEAEDEEE